MQWLVKPQKKVGTPNLSTKRAAAIPTCDKHERFQPQDLSERLQYILFAKLVRGLITKVKITRLLSYEEDSYE
jgi:hypothetical protein